jgi:acyl-CoA thioesterase-2
MPASSSSRIVEAKAHLDVTRTGPASFRSTPHPGRPTRSYGGDVAGQAVMAASLTVPADRPIHSAHMYFLAPGNSSIPVDHEVTVLRDGGSFSARQVVAGQTGGAIFTMTASFQAHEPGLAHSVSAPEPGGTAQPAGTPGRAAGSPGMAELDAADGRSGRPFRPAPGARRSLKG